MPRWAESHVLSIVLTCFWASDPNNLRMRVSAASSIQVVCVKWRAKASRTMVERRLLHSPMNFCLKAMARSATFSERGRGVQFWNPLNLPCKSHPIRCSVNCCRKVVGDFVPVNQKTYRSWVRLHFLDASPNIYLWGLRLSLSCHPSKRPTQQISC